MLTTFKKIETWNFWQRTEYWKTEKTDLKKKKIFKTKKLQITTIKILNHRLNSRLEKAEEKLNVLEGKLEETTHIFSSLCYIQERNGRDPFKKWI